MDSTEKRYETIRKRLEALWENEILDRCCVSVLAPRDPQRPYRENPPESQEDLCRWYNDAQWIQERNLERIRRTYFAGDEMCIRDSHTGRPRPRSRATFPFASWKFQSR